MVIGNYHRTQYVIEWVTLLILLFIIIAYIATTLTFHLKGKVLLFTTIYGEHFIL